MVSSYGLTPCGCLIGILACSTLISALSANDVNMSMFDCHLCTDYVYCASRYVATVDDIACDQINMRRSLVSRQAKTTTSILEKCGFPLPGVDGRSGYWIMISVGSSVGNLIHNISNHYIDQHQNGGQFPYICEEHVRLGWKEIDGRLYRRTNRRHALCTARKVCGNYGGALCTMEGTNLTHLVLEFRLAHIMPSAIWVNNTGKPCNGPTSQALHFIDSTTSRYEVSTSTLILFALCEKRFGVNIKSSSGTTNPPPATAATPTSAVLSTVAPSSALAVTQRQHTPTAVQTSGWIMDSPREFYVNRNQSNFTAATESCRSTLNASLVFFTDPLKYLDMSQTLGLTPGHFWVGVYVNNSHHKCLQLKVRQGKNAFLSNADCPQMAASICSRTSNVSDVVGSPTFSRLLADMKVDSLETQTSKRKLVSVYDNMTLNFAVNDSHHKCLQLRVGQNNDAFLSRADCRQMAASICSRTSNVSDVLDNPVFNRLLADMKVDSSETQKSKRKLVSVHDERKSALAVGSIGVIAVISVFTLIALLDLTRLKCRCKYDDSKKTKVKVVRARKASERASSGLESTC